MRTNMLNDALELYGQCLEYDDLNAQYNQSIMYNRGCALNKLGQNDKALEDLELAIKMNRDYAKAYIKRGDIFLQLEHYQEAIAEYSKVKEFAP